MTGLVNLPRWIQCTSGVCDSNRIDEYLKTMWVLQEEGKRVIRVKHLSQMLGVSTASVVGMLKGLREKNYVQYEPGEGSSLTSHGKAIARRLVRNHRLMELFVESRLGLPIDQNMICGFSHHMNDRFSQSICSTLGHPRNCPHGRRIPPCKSSLKNA